MGAINQKPTPARDAYERRHGEPLPAWVQHISNQWKGLPPTPWSQPASKSPKEKQA